MWIWYTDLVSLQRFQALWELNRIHEKVTQHTFFGSWENMAYYHLFPTAANRALAEYEHKWKDFNMDVIDSARKVCSCPHLFRCAVSHKFQTHTPCRAERMFHTVEEGDLTMEMVSDLITKYSLHTS